MKKTIGVIGLSTLLFLAWLNSAPAASHDGSVRVPPGTTAMQVVQALSADGQVRSVKWFRFLLKATGTGRRLHVGVYPVEKGLSAWGLVSRLRSGRGMLLRVTIPEGWTAAQVAQRMEAEGVCAAQAFTAAVSSASAEGFLFPDTYEFDPFISAERARDLMVARFDGAWREAVLDSSATVTVSTVSAREDRVKIGARWWSVREVATLASIVEREGGRPDQRSSIAAVYHNRLKKGMRLEADPTVLYALGRWKERLYFKDLDVDSPYNTYRRYGLPPGPIGSPGLVSLEAVLAPAPVPYLYFIADGEGGHLFSATFAEHSKNVRDRDKRRDGRPIEGGPDK